MPITTETRTDQLAIAMMDALATNKGLNVKDNGDFALRESKGERLQGKLASSSSKQERLVRLITDTVEKEGLQSLDTFKRAVNNGFSEAHDAGMTHRGINKVTSRYHKFMDAINRVERDVDVDVVKANLKAKLANAEMGTHFIPVTQAQLAQGEEMISSMSDDPMIWGEMDRKDWDEPPALFEKDSGRGWSYTLVTDEGNETSFIQSTDSNPYTGEEGFELLKSVGDEIGAKGIERTRVAQGLASVLNQGLHGTTVERFRMEALPEMLISRDQRTTTGIAGFEAEIKPNGDKVDITISTPAPVKGFIMDTMGADIVRLDEEGKIGHQLDVVKFSLDSKELLKGNARVVPGSLRVDQSITIKQDLNLAYNMA